jgi:hypothetical protein
MQIDSQICDFWKKNNERVVLIIILMVFMVSSLFVALTLKTGIIPDEPAHFIFSKHYSTTLGIPPDSIETYSWGWYIKQNPFLYHWIMGRVINITTLINPTISDLGLLRTLRVVNTFFALGTVIFCFLLSDEIIKKKWWRLLPVLILTNILMFVFLAGGVNYDNLANLLSIAAIYFFILALKQTAFITHTLLWMIFIGLGTLVKFPILPLALAMAIAWMVRLITQRKALIPFKLIRPHLILFVLLLIIIGGNFAIYGINLIRYQALTPPCPEILTITECEISPFIIRYQEIALEEKLTITESIRMGFPSPLRYALDDWVWHILLRSFGVVGHQSYFPLHLILFYQIVFYLTLFLSFINLLYHRKINTVALHLFWVMLFYSITLLINNYNSELVYGFLQISLQGRYIFPIIGIILVLLTHVYMKVPSRLIQWVSVLFIIGLAIYGGTLTILLGYDTIFSGWFY